MLLALVGFVAGIQLFEIDSSRARPIEIEGFVPGRSDSQVDRVLGRVLSELRFAELEQILRSDLHTFLAGVLERCAEVSATVQDQYALH